MATYRRPFARTLIIPIFAVALAAHPGFRGETFDYSLPGPGESASGTSWIALPSQLDGITDCGDLMAQIPDVVGLSRFNRPDNTFVACSCPGENCFSVDPGEGYQVQVSASSTFQLSGNDAVVTIQLIAQGAGSKSGLNLISLPFGVSGGTAQDLVDDIGGLVGAGGPVFNVQRYLPANDTVEVYVGGRGDGFILESGVGYRVRVAADTSYTPTIGGDFCPSEMSCTFNGLPNSALGAATLSLDAEGNLVVSDIGTSGLDGVEVLNPPGPMPRSGHEEWIELGLVAWKPIVDSSTPVGAFIRFRSFASFVPDEGQEEVSLLVEKIAAAPTSIRITPDFSDAGAGTYRYVVWDNGQLRLNKAGLTGPVLASGWPTRQAFSLVEWPDPVQIMLPDGSSASGDELEIVPETNESVGIVQRMTVTARSAPTTRTGARAIASLTSLTITEESFEGATAPTEPVPTLEQWALIGLALLLLGLGLSVIHRRHRVLPPPGRAV